MLFSSIFLEVVLVVGEKGTPDDESVGIGDFSKSM